MLPESLEARMRAWFILLGLVAVLEAKPAVKFQVVTSVLSGDSAMEPVTTEIGSFLAREIRSFGDAEYADYTEHTRADRKTFCLLVILGGIKLGGGTPVYNLTFIASEFMNQELMDMVIGSGCNVKYDRVEPLLHSTSILGFYTRSAERSDLKQVIESAVAQFDAMALEPHRKTLAAKKRK